MRTLRRAVGTCVVAALSATFVTAGAAVDPALCKILQPIDRATTPSSDCLTCHDGTNASNARTGHRFDMEYLPLPGKDLRADPVAFNAKVVLGTGSTVTCTTCHDPASDLADHLAAPTSGPPPQRLCIACHVQ